MAEIATLARPYAEALFQVALKGDAAALAQDVAHLASALENDAVRQFVSHPKVGVPDVIEVVGSLTGGRLGQAAQNLLRVLAENERLTVAPEISVQLQKLLAEHSGVADATVYSAFPIDAAQLADLKTTLEKRFNRPLRLNVQSDESLIGGVRVVVGDEVLDSSVKARLEQMRVSLTS